MSAVFITSTGTDVGKTFVACGLIRHICDQERIVDAVKPVVSGFLPRKAAISDPGLLLTALDVLAGSELEVLRVVVSDTARTASLEANARAIARFAAGREVLTLPRLPRNSFRHPTFVQ